MFLETKSWSNKCWDMREHEDGKEGCKERTHPGYVETMQKAKLEVKVFERGRVGKLILSASHP
jgi:hypothetical protein